MAYSNSQREIEGKSYNVTSSSSCSWRFGRVSLFLNSQDEAGPSISSLVVLYFFVLSVYTVVLVLVFCLCPCNVTLSPKRLVCDYLKNRGLMRRLKPENSTPSGQSCIVGICYQEVQWPNRTLFIVTNFTSTAAQCSVTGQITYFS
jgi:hypothetical protein